MITATKEETMFSKAINQPKTGAESIRNKGYLPEIDGMRALAVLAVIIYHMDLSFLRGGFTGVDLFFVISGYVISRSCFQNLHLSFKEFMITFYYRRIKRIFPVLMLAMTLIVLASVLFIPNSWLSDSLNQSGLSAYWGASNFWFFFQNNGYYATASEYNPFLHTWSLAVEEQFYLLFPFLLFLWQRLRGKSKRDALRSRLLFPVLALVSLYFSAFWTIQQNIGAFYLLPSRFWELAAGVMLSQLHHRKERAALGQQGSRRTIFSPLIYRLMTATGFLLVLISFGAADLNAFPFPWAWGPVAAALLMIQGLQTPVPGDSLVNRFLSSRPMVYLGKISYSLYLWHWPVAVMLRWTTGFESLLSKVLYVMISITLALLSYELVEKPLRYGSAISRFSKPAILMGGALILLCCFSLSWGMIHFKSRLSLSVTRENTIWRSGRYWQDKRDQPDYSSQITEGRTLFALGDSHTAHYRTMLNILSIQLGIKTVEYEQGGGAVAGLLSPMTESTASFYQKALQEIQVQAVPGDLVFLASLRMPELCYRFEKVDMDEVMEHHFSAAAEKNRRLALEEADSIISDLEALGLTVLISAPEPLLRIPPYRCSDWFNRRNPIAQPGPSVSRNLLEEIRQPMMDSLTWLQQNHPSLEVWDSLPILCDEKELNAYDHQGLPLFYDGDHLSGHGNRLLVPSFRDKLLEIWSK